MQEEMSGVISDPLGTWPPPNSSMSFFLSFTSFKEALYFGCYLCSPDGV